jgi:hypothetical protein
MSAILSLLKGKSADNFGLSSIIGPGRLFSAPHTSKLIHVVEELELRLLSSRCEDKIKSSLFSERIFIGSHQMGISLESRAT